MKTFKSAESTTKTTNPFQRKTTESTQAEGPKKVVNPFLRSRTTTDKAASDDKPEDEKSEGDKPDDKKSDGDKPEEDKPSDEKKGGLFGASMKGGLFQKTTDLFGKQRSSTFGGRSLFDGKSTFNQ